MFITNIQAEWIDYNPTIEEDIYKVTFYTNQDLIKELECTKSNLADKIHEVLYA